MQENNRKHIASLYCCSVLTASSDFEKLTSVYNHVLNHNMGCCTLCMRIKPYNQFTEANRCRYQCSEIPQLKPICYVCGVTNYEHSYHSKIYHNFFKINSK